MNLNRLSLVTVGVALLTASGCASSTKGMNPSARAPSAARTKVKFTCGQYQGHRFEEDQYEPKIKVIEVQGSSAFVSSGASKSREYKVDMDQSRPVGRSKVYTAEVVDSTGEDAVLSIDTRMMDGSWKEDEIRNSAGTAIFPELVVIFTTFRDNAWDCKPGDNAPTY